MRLDKKGFSFVELVIVIAVIAILAVAGISVLNPSSRMSDANAATREKDAEAIAQAIKIAISNNNEMPAEIAAIASLTPTLLVTTGDPGVDTYYCDKLGYAIPKINIASHITALVGDLPVDPDLDSASTDTGYFVVRKGNLFNVASCGDGQDCSTCTDNCVGCPTCGDGIVESNEACDDSNVITESCGNGVEEDAGTHCNATCTATTSIAISEICDDNNTITEGCGNGTKEDAGDYCSADCSADINIAVNEGCDYNAWTEDCQTVMSDGEGGWIYTTENDTGASFCFDDCSIYKLTCS